MYVYKVKFGNGAQIEVRANSPKEAYEKASEMGIVTFVKYLRGK